ncbi:MAG TPA: glycosyltransferase family 2 protein, partial [Acidobacteriota bacterium]|nr:glycosyltransferase family 2 protein [Acidobacteriota bacterium]
RESLKLSVCQNARPKGFAANHNTAFRASKGTYFCVLNPDVRLRQDPFPRLLAGLRDPDIGVIAPRVIDPEGRIEDNARRFPTLTTLFGKALGVSARLDYPMTSESFEPDWVAGMFMLFKAEAFRRVGGFDERYFLYYEDVDICARLRAMGFQIRVDPMTTVIHDARRESHRNPGHLAWHLQSMLRFLFTRPRKLPPLP